MEVVITGVTGLRNRGVEALVSVILEQVLRSPDVTATVLTATPDYDALRAGRDRARFAVNGFRRSPSRSDRIRQRLSHRAGRADPTYAASVDLVRGADLVIATGGDVFSSDYGANAFHLAPLEEALDAGRRVAFLAHSIGPFTSPGEADHWLAVARRATVSVRESLTHEYLTQTLGMPESAVSLVADPAFLLSPPGPDEVDRLLELHGVDGSRPFVVLCPSRGIARYAGGDVAAHQAAWRRAIDHVRKSLCDQVVILPHVQERSPGNDDRLHATEILRGLDDADGVRLVGGDLSAGELKGIVGRSRLVCSERFHAIVAGLSTGVPAIPVAYSVKARGILRDFAGPDVARQLLLEYTDFSDPHRMTERLDAAWADAAGIREHFRERLPEAQARARRAFGELGLAA